MISLDNQLRQKYHKFEMKIKWNSKQKNYDTRTEYINTEIFTIFDFDFFHFQSTVNEFSF